MYLDIDQQYASCRLSTISIYATYYNIGNLLRRLREMPRGRPAKAPTRSLNIRVDVDDLDMLAIIQTVTKVPTAEVVRDFLKDYIARNDGLLKALGTGLKEGARSVPMQAFPRGQIEHDEEQERLLAQGNLVWPDGSPVKRDPDED
jgi:hypothetical protein